MTLPSYTSSREGEERDARGPARSASLCDRRRPPEEAASNLDINEEGETTMGMIRVISHRGDEHLLWNEQDAVAGDAEAIAALREVERIFAQERATGATAFRAQQGKSVDR